MDEAMKNEVLAERGQLAARMLALRKFMYGDDSSPEPAFEALPLAERQRMSTQLSAMGVYRDVLEARIAADFQ
jgi:hypothetical protein